MFHRGDRGIDVSEHQGIIDWAETQKHIDFAFIKAWEYRLDHQFIRNYNQVTAVRRGFYLFAHPDEFTPAQSANGLLYAVRDRGGWGNDDIPILDLEDGSGVLREWTAETLDRISQGSGREAWLYSGVPFMHEHGLFVPSLQHTPLWIARYTTDTHDIPILEPGFTCRIWQYSSSGQVHGIDGNIDMNIVLEDEMDIAAVSNALDRIWEVKEALEKAGNKDAAKLFDAVVAIKVGVGLQSK